MILFTSDLDNTLIYSYKHDIGEDKRCVEIYQGREVCFITNTSYELLHKVNERICFIPTTTRTIEQYERIDFGLGSLPYALVCNGGKLLVDGVSDDEWYQESRERIKECDETMEQAVKLLEADPHRTFETRYIDQLFIFTKSDSPDESIEYLKSNLDTEKVEVFKNGIKVYVTPKMLTKGDAVLRLKERLQPEKIIAAGDSEFDLSMLQVADLAFAPKELMESMRGDAASQSVSKRQNNRCQKEKEKYIIHDDTELFSEEILRYLLEVIR